MSQSGNWVSDNAALVIGTVLNVLGLLAGVLFWRLGRRPKTLDWELVDHGSMVKVAAARSVNLEVRWEGRDVSSPALATVRILNTGKEHIQASDFVQPLSINVSGGELLSADITNVPTEDFLDSPLVRNASQVSIVPKLLNRSESFSVQLFVDGSNPEITVAARVAGLSRPIRRMTQSQRAREAQRFRLVMILSTITTACAYAWLVANGVGVEVPPWFGFALGVLLAVMIGMELANIVETRKDRRRTR
jgi:hypothetical protein